jgi:hypothetical protein
MTIDERYLDHYARFLGEPIAAFPFQISDEVPAIRILEYDKVIAGCHVFASLGLSSYPGEDGEICEVICPVDRAFSDVPSILANALFRLVAREPYQPGRGLAIDGIDTVNAGFSKKYNKQAIYLTDPFELPEEFAFIGEDEGDGRMHLAIFLSQQEYAYLVANGCESLEDRLEEKQVDPYDIQRPSCV